MRMRFAIPRLESGKRAKNIGRRCFLLNDRRKTGKDLLRDRHETREHFGSRLAVVPPAELGPHGSRCGGHRDLLAFRRGDGFGDGAHEIEAAMREGAFALKRFDAFGPFAANVALGLGAAACRKFERVKKGGRRFHPALPERGGRERESNPPKTGSRPPPAASTHSLQMAAPSCPANMVCTSSFGLPQNEQRTTVLPERASRIRPPSSPGRSCHVPASPAAVSAARNCGVRESQPSRVAAPRAASRRWPTKNIAS